MALTAMATRLWVHIMAPCVLAAMGARNFAIAADAPPPGAPAAPLVDVVLPRAGLGLRLNGLKGLWASALNLPEKGGEFVQGVVAGSAADQAGIHPGDVIVSLDGRADPARLSIFDLLLMTKPGTKVAIGLIRGGRHLVVNTVLSAPTAYPAMTRQFMVAFQPAAFAAPAFDKDAKLPPAMGLDALAMTPEIGRQMKLADPQVAGVILTKVLPGSPAEALGLRRGDIITSADLRAVTSPAQLAEIVAERMANSRQAILVTVQRGNDLPVFMPLPLPAR